VSSNVNDLMEKIKLLEEDILRFKVENSGLKKEIAEKYIKVRIFVRVSRS
jgi:hypothetical protein